MENISKLRDELSLIFYALKSGEIKHKDAAELNNAAGKMINSARVQLEYQKLKGERPNIKFLEGK